MGLSQESTNIGNCILLCFSLFFPLGFKEFCLVYRYYFGFSHRVFQRFSSHFSWKVFGRDILYCISWFFPWGFQGVIRLIQDHKKIKLITRPWEEQIDQRGVLRRKIELVINLLIRFIKYAVTNYTKGPLSKGPVLSGRDTFHPCTYK